jgi:AcrR family transcriptional regulator
VPEPSSTGWKEADISRTRRGGSGASPADLDPRGALLAAAEECLGRHGFVGLSTRRVADAAGMPLSQIHYHFGSKDALVLALLAYKNARLLERQQAMYAEDVPLWKRWKQACDFLDEDLASGYVRVLQEMVAAGWSNHAVAKAVRQMLSGWFELLNQVAAEAAKRFADTGPLKPDDVAALVGASFVGAEALILLGFDEGDIPLRRALRRFGAIIQRAEELA